MHTTGCKRIQTNVYNSIYYIHMPAHSFKTRHTYILVQLFRYVWVHKVPRKINKNLKLITRNKTNQSGSIYANAKKTILLQIAPCRSLYKIYTYISIWVHKHACYCFCNCIRLHINDITRIPSKSIPYISFEYYSDPSHMYMTMSMY
jgi:hypothetical protein